MHPKIVILALPLLFLSSPLFAQDDSQKAAIRGAIEMQRQVTEAERTMIVTDNVPLTATESEEFWPLYRQYRGDVADLNDRRLAIIQEYAKNWESLADEEAMKLLNASFRLETDRVKLSKKYSKKLNKVMPGAKVVRFMQIERRLDAVIEMKLSNSIPLAM